MPWFRLGCPLTDQLPRLWDIASRPPRSSGCGGISQWKISRQRFFLCLSDRHFYVGTRAASVAPSSAAADKQSLPRPLPAARSPSLFLRCGTWAFSGCPSHQRRSREHPPTQALQVLLSEIRAEVIHRHEASRPPGSASSSSSPRTAPAPLQPPGPLPVLPVLLLLMLVTLLSSSPPCLPPGAPVQGEAGERREEGGPRSLQGASLPHA